MPQDQNIQQIHKKQQRHKTTSKRIKNSQQNVHKPFVTQKRRIQTQKRKNKSAQFHQSISKSKRQQLFAKSRQTNHIKYIHTQMDTIAKQLTSQYQRLQFIDSILQKMQGQPNESWRQGMNCLLWSIKTFYIEKEMYLWVERGIVQKLCETFDKRFRQQSLWHKGAYLLQKFIFLQPQSLQYVINWNQKGFIIKQAYKCSIQKDSTLTQVSNCVQLLATMLSINCKKILNIIGIDKAISYCIQWLQRILKQMKSTQKALRKVYRYMIYLSKQISHQWQSLSIKVRLMVNKLIQLLNETVQLHQPHENHQKLFTIIYNLTKYTIYTNPQNQNQIQNYLHSPNIPNCMVIASKSNILDKIKQMTDFSFNQTVKIVIKILNFSVQFQQQPIQLQQMLQQYLKKQNQKHKQQPNPNKKTTQKTIPIINNFISYLLLIYNQNPRAKTFIQKVYKFFKLLTSKIIHPQIQQTDENHTQYFPQEIQI